MTARGEFVAYVRELLNPLGVLEDGLLALASTRAIQPSSFCGSAAL